MPRSEAAIVTCSFCSKPVSLEDSVTDDKGRAAHAECYLRSVQKRSEDSLNPASNV